MDMSKHIPALTSVIPRAASIWLAATLCAAQVAAQPGDLVNRLAKRDLVRDEPVDSIPNYRLDGWNYVDPTHLIMHGGPSEKYLLELMTPCRDLSHVETIGVSSTASSLTKFDTVLLRGAGGIAQQCPIKQIYRLHKVE
jgi:Family of unknown function (DUF6491)